MSEAEDVSRAAGALLGSHGPGTALRICDTQIATASRFGDLDALHTERFSQKVETATSERVPEAWPA